MGTEAAVLSDPAAIRAFILRQQYRALRCEVAHTLPITRINVKQAIQRFHGIHGRTKRDVLANFGAWLVEQGILTPEEL